MNHDNDMSDTHTAAVPTPIRVLIVDDQELIRYGLRLVLEAEPDIVVVGEATNGEDAVHAALRLRPHLVLMDVRMPGLDGIEATKLLSQKLPATRVLVLTTYDLDEFAFGSLQAGAAGFLLKNTPPRELTTAIRTLIAGESVISPRITKKLIEFALPHLSRTPHDPSSQHEQDRDFVFSTLTEREQEIFLQVGLGLSNSEIAEKLHVSESTVKAHFGRILTKLGVTNRVQVVIRAYELGVVQAS